MWGTKPLTADGLDVGTVGLIEFRSSTQTLVGIGSQRRTSSEKEVQVPPTLEETQEGESGHFLHLKPKTTKPKLVWDRLSGPDGKARDLKLTPCVPPSRLCRVRLHQSRAETSS